MPVALGFIPIQFFMPKVKDRCSVIAPTHKAPLTDCANRKVCILITPSREGFIEAMNRTYVFLEDPEIAALNTLRRGPCRRSAFFCSPA